MAKQGQYKSTYSDSDLIRGEALQALTGHNDYREGTGRDDEPHNFNGKCRHTDCRTARVHGPLGSDDYGMENPKMPTFIANETNSRGQPHWRAYCAEHGKLSLHLFREDAIRRCELHAQQDKLKSNETGD